MAKRPWMSNGKPVMRNGHPILCESCPCSAPADCAERVSRTVNRLLNEKDETTGQYVWSHVGSYSASFSCASWSYNQALGTWVLVQPSSGTLLAAVPHTAFPNVSYEAIPFISAQVLYHNAQGFYRVIGCRCVPDATTYQCVPTYSVYDGYDIIGAVPVYPVPESSESISSSVPPVPDYHISDVCRFDKCELLKAWLIKLSVWYGGILHGEGFSDWWDGEYYDPWMMSEYYRFSKYIGAWEVQARYDETQAEYTLVIEIPCDCSAFLVHALADGHRLHDFEGICALSDDCALNVMMYMRYYEDMEYTPSDSGSASASSVPLWEEVGMYNGGYECAVWEESDSEGSPSTPASGSLVIAFSTYIPMEDYGWYEPIDGCGRRLVYAGMLRNRETGAYKVVGCECRYSNMTCSIEFVQLDNYRVAGILPVGGETPCSVDACAVGELYLTSMAQWHTGTSSYGEGYVEYINPTTGEYTYTLHKKGFTWTGDVPEGGGTAPTFFMYMPCSATCSCTMSWTNVTGKTIRTLPGICDKECPDYFALRASASAHGWEFREEGILMHKAHCYKYVSEEVVHTVGDWFELSDYMTTGKACAIAEGMMYILSCSCDNTQQPGYYIIEKDTTKYGVDGPEEGEAPEGYWDWVEYEGACSCVDLRELMLEDPERYGVVDISYGNHTKYKYTYTWTETDPVTFEEITHTETVYDTVGYRGTSYYEDRNNMYLEYRTFCWIQKSLDSNCTEKKCIRCISPEGSPAKSHDRTYNQNFYDDIEFAGHAVPFSHDSDINWDWIGNILQWDTWCSCLESGGCYDTSAEAEAVCNAASPTDCHCSASSSYNQTTGYWIQRMPTPDTSLVYHSGRVEQIGTQYCCWLPYYTMGREVSYKGGKFYIAYREQWIETNKGFLRYGESGYVSEIFLYGILDYNPDWYCSNGSYCHNTTIHAQIDDEDMHPCEGHDPDWQQDSSSSD